MGDSARGRRSRGLGAAHAFWTVSLKMLWGASTGCPVRDTGSSGQEAWCSQAMFPGLNSSSLWSCLPEGRGCFRLARWMPSHFLLHSVCLRCHESAPNRAWQRHAQSAQRTRIYFYPNTYITPFPKGSALSASQTSPQGPSASAMYVLSYSLVQVRRPRHREIQRPAQSHTYKPNSQL